MAKLVYGMMQSLDGYLDDAEGSLVLPGPDEELFRHFTEQVRGVSGRLYGRRTYELMRYWDEDRPEHFDLERDYGEVWRARPKWVVSRDSAPVGPNAHLAGGDLEAFVRRIKDEVQGEIDVAGPTGGVADRLGPDRRIPAVPPPLRAGRGEAVLRSDAAGVAADRRGPHRFGHGPAGLRALARSSMS